MSLERELAVEIEFLACLVQIVEHDLGSACDDAVVLVLGAFLLHELDGISVEAPASVIRGYPQVRGVFRCQIVHYDVLVGACTDDRIGSCLLDRRYYRSDSDAASDDEISPSLLQVVSVTVRASEPEGVVDGEFVKPLGRFADGLHRDALDPSCFRQGHGDLFHSGDPDHSELSGLCLRIPLELEGLCIITFVVDPDDLSVISHWQHLPFLR